MTSYLSERGPIRRLFIANRGEIAVRIIRAARELGIETVLGISSADRESLAARLADSTMELGPPAAAKSYLNIDAVLAAIETSGADAIHPGYGFLSENADFAHAVRRMGRIFVGPDPETIEVMGNKAVARECAMRAGVPTVPGTPGVVSDVEAALGSAAAIGFPVMLKAAAGGGGKGIRVARNLDELATMFVEAQREALAAFGDGGIYLEKFIGRARHIEVQVLGDGQDVIHLYDRECSLQRRRQKILEEAPAPSLSEEVRERLCAAAVALARSVSYSSAGTIEFLYDDDTSEFFFIEMNTRIQVEHPTTEMVTGIDLVREMLCIAGGARLRFKQDNIRLHGVAIECRLNAEDPERGFLPSPGTINGLRLPGGPGVRVDSMLYDGYKVSPFYDSLLAKVIVWDENRSRAISRMKRALGEIELGGIKSTLPLHLRLLDDEAVQSANYHTNFLEAWLAAGTD
jgi:acetyl-CoA carboxylase biotin carboxylase subunit